MTKTLMIPQSMLQNFKEEVATLAKRAARLNVAAPVVVETGHTSTRTRTTYSDQGAIIYRWTEMFHEVTVTGARVMLPGGWRIMGRLEMTLDGQNVVMAGQIATDLPAEWRDTKAVTECDHCGQVRRRTHTLVLQNEAGKIIKVGSACVRDFTGSNNDPVLLAEIAAQIDSVLDTRDEDMATGSGFGGGVATFQIKQILEIAAQTVLNGIYTSSSKAFEEGGTSTATGIRNHDFGNLAITPAAVELADAALAWGREIQNPESEYLKSLTALIANNADRVLGKHVGLMISIVPAYQRALADAAKEKVAEINEYFGAVGDKFDGVEGTLMHVVPVESFYGTSLLHIIRSAAGHSMVWFCSGARPEVEIGQKIWIAGTIKAHNLRNGNKQTVLTRAVLRDAPLPPPAPKKARKAAAAK